MTVLERKKAAPFKPNYIRLLPPGEVIAEKIFEMGLSAVDLASRCEVSLDDIQKLLKGEMPLTDELAHKIELITQMGGKGLMQLEARYRKDREFLRQHPEFPVVQ